MRCFFVVYFQRAGLPAYAAIGLSGVVLIRQLQLTLLAMRSSLTLEIEIMCCSRLNLRAMMAEWVCREQRGLVQASSLPRGFSARVCPSSAALVD